MRSDTTRDVIRTALGVVAALALTSTAMLVAGCNTTEGVGEDISAAGDAIDNAAEDAKD